MTGTTRRVFPLLLAAAIALGGCARPQQAPPIVVALVDDVVSLDPAGTKDITSETVARCVFSTLYTFDEQMDLVPCLATGARQVSDLVWEFGLREDATFHDGGQLTASDVKFSLERALNAQRADASLAVIAGVAAIGAHMVQISTQYPVVNLPALLVRTSTSIMSERAMAKPDYDLDKPVGSGPFQVTQRVPGESIDVQRYDGYFGGAPKWEKLRFVVERSEQSATSAILNGTMDVLFRVSATDGDYLNLNEEVTLYQTDSTKTELLCLNATVPPLDDIRVRQAIAFSIDKQNVVGNVLDGYGRAVNSMLPAPLPGYIEFDEYRYDPAQARQLLGEAGYPDGIDLTVLTFDVQRKKLMEYLKLDMAKANIRLNYEFLELQDYLKLVETRNFMGSVMSWTSNPDPDSTFTQLYSQEGHPSVNQTSFYDARVEALLQQGRREQDPGARRAIYEEINQIVASSYHVIPLYQPSALIAARSNIKGVRINAQGLFGYESLYREEG